MINTLVECMRVQGKKNKTISPVDGMDKDKKGKG